MQAQEKDETQHSYVKRLLKVQNPTMPMLNTLICTVMILKDA